MQQGEGLLQTPDGENISLSKVVTYQSQKPANVKYRNDKLGMCSVNSIWICTHSSHC